MLDSIRWTPGSLWKFPVVSLHSALTRWGPARSRPCRTTPTLEDQRAARARRLHPSAPSSPRRRRRRRVHPRRRRPPPSPASPRPIRSSWEVEEEARVRVRVFARRSPCHPPTRGTCPCLYRQPRPGPPRTCICSATRLIPAPSSSPLTKRLPRATKPCAYPA